MMLAVPPLPSLILACRAPPRPDPAEVRKTFDAVIRKPEQQMLSGVVDTTLASCTDDAVSLPAHGPLLRGKDAIRGYHEQMKGMGMKCTAVDFITLDAR